MNKMKQNSQITVLSDFKKIIMNETILVQMKNLQVSIYLLFLLLNLKKILDKNDQSVTKCKFK